MRVQDNKPELIKAFNQFCEHHKFYPINGAPVLSLVSYDQGAFDMWYLMNGHKGEAKP